MGLPIEIFVTHQRCESVCRTLVQAYWSADTEAQSLLKAAMRQCRREVILTTEPLRVDCQDSISCDHSGSPLVSDADIRSSSDESELAVNHLKAELIFSFKNSPDVP